MSMGPTTQSADHRGSAGSTQRDVIKVLLAAGQEVVRRGYRDMVADQPDISVTAEVGSGEKILQAVSEVIPHVVVITSDLPPTGGMELTRKITRMSDASVVMTASRDHDADLSRAVQMGVGAYLPISFTGEELVCAIRAVKSGAAFLSPRSVRRLFDNFLLLPTVPTDAIPDELNSLSSREVEVVRGIGQGKSNREIARQLSISEATVKSHVTSTLKKLTARDRLHVALISWQLGLVPIQAGMKIS